MGGAIEWLDMLLVAVAGLAVALGAVRAIRGPLMVDRVIALDMLTVSGVAFAALAAHATGSRQFLDVGLGIAMLGFIATIAFARLIERLPPEDGATIEAAREEMAHEETAHEETAHQGTAHGGAAREEMAGAAPDRGGARP